MIAKHGEWFAEPLNDATGVRLIKTTADDMREVVPVPLDERRDGDIAVLATEMAVFSDVLITRSEVHVCAMGLQRPYKKGMVADVHINHTLILTMQLIASMEQLPPTRERPRYGVAHLTAPMPRSMRDNRDDDDRRLNTKNLLLPVFTELTGPLTVRPFGQHPERHVDGVFMLRGCCNLVARPGSPRKLLANPSDVATLAALRGYHQKIIPFEEGSERFWPDKARGALQKLADALEQRWAEIATRH
jgi:hypothetical protein